MDAILVPEDPKILYEKIRSTGLTVPDQGFRVWWLGLSSPGWTLLRFAGRCFTMPMLAVLVLLQEAGVEKVIAVGPKRSEVWELNPDLLFRGLYDPATHDYPASLTPVGDEYEVFLEEDINAWNEESYERQPA